MSLSYEEVTFNPGEDAFRYVNTKRRISLFIVGLWLIAHNF